MEVVMLLVGAGLQEALRQLIDGVTKANREAAMFKSLLRELRTTLQGYEKIVEDIEQFHPEGVRPLPDLDDFKTKIDGGKLLVGKCSKIRRRHLKMQFKMKFFKEHKYGEQLVQLNIDLQTLFNTLKWQVRLQMQATVNRIDRNVVAQNRNDNQIRGWCVAPYPPSFTVGLDNLKDLKIKFLRDDEVSMLVLSAPGGCGKTTLAQMFCQDEEVKDIFKDNIFFVTVSENLNLDRIVEELYQRTGSVVPNFQNEGCALIWLQEFLTKTGQNPLLLVLDDVWPGSSESLLDMCHTLKMPNYKVLVTSRSQFPRFDSYILNPLNRKEAMALFIGTASMADQPFDIPEDLVAEVVNLCKGFPLAISVIAKDLCNQPVEIWKRRLEKLSEGSSILDSEKLLLSRLQTSLDALDKGLALVKECFIDLGSFPEDCKIPVAALIDIWAELHELLQLDYSSIACLHDLNSRSLANLVVTRNEKQDADGYYSEHFATQHDILRSLAIHQTATGQSRRLNIDMDGDIVPKWWAEQKRKPKKTRLLSISTDGAFTSKWQEMHLPNAEVLVLNFQTVNYAFPKFDKKMSKSLKVLIVTNYGVLQAQVSNFTLLGSLSNLKRTRLERISIPSITKNNIRLESLQKMSFFMCSTCQAFRSSSVKFFEAFPNLQEINIDYCNDLVELPLDLCLLVHLKKLTVTNSHKLLALPERIGKLVKLEVLRLRSCIDLSELPGSMRNLKALKCLDISNCFSIKELPEHIGEICSLEKLNMRQCTRLKELPESFTELKQLKDVICDEERRELLEPFLHILDTNLRVNVVEEEVNLNWL